MKQAEVPCRRAEGNVTTWGMALTRDLSKRRHLSYPAPMQLFLFKSGNDPDVFALTVDRTGMNLPREMGPWTLIGNGAVPATVGPDLSDVVMAAVTQYGYFVGSSE